MKKSLLFLVAITTVVLVGCGNSNENEVVYPSTNFGEVQEIQNQEVSANGEESVIQLTENEQAREMIFDLFSEHIENLSNISGDELSEFKIEKVDILEDDDKEDLISNFSGDYFVSDVLASVTYSVRPIDSNSMSWIAGNGEQSGDWIVNKVQCVILRDGKLTVVGTGW